MRQGDPLSPTLFSIFLNDLVEHIKQLGIGIEIDGIIICILLYADDIVLLAKSEAELQSLILSMEQWCQLYQLKVNVNKTKIVHFRNCRKCPTEFIFKMNENVLDKVEVYKYLGVYFHENMKFDIHADKMANSGSRALGSVISKFK